MFHAVVTRVSLLRPATGDPERGGLSAKLYARICRKSLAQQSCRDFVALSAWGTRGDGKPLPNEKQLVAPAVPDQFHEAGRLFASAILMMTNEPVVLVTRVDSDDALAKDFVEQVQFAARKAPRLEMPWYYDASYIWQTTHGSTEMRLRTFPATYVSPFVTVRCPREKLVAVLSQVMRQHGSTPTVTAGGVRLPDLMVLQTIHRNNISNKRKGDVAQSSPPFSLFLGEGVVCV